MPDLSDAAVRAHLDPEFLQRVAARYHGTQDLADALWWRTHPMEPGPSGAPSPRILLRELQEAAYSAGSDGPARIAARARLEQLQSDLASEEALLTAALEGADDEREIDDHPLNRASSPPDRREPGLRGRRAMLPLALAAFVGAVVAVAVVNIALPRGGGGVPLSTAPTAAPTHNATLDRLLDAQGDDDLPLGATAQAMFLAGVDLDSTRRLDVLPLDPDSVSEGDSTSTAAGGVDAVYLATDIDGLICLEAQRIDGQLVGSCAERAAVESSGLRVVWSAAEPVDAAEPDAGPSFSLMTVALGSDGNVTSLRARAFSPRSAADDGDLAAVYSGYVDSYQCLVHAGYSLSEPPSFAAFVAQDETDRWSPWKEVALGVALERAIASC